MSNFGGILSQGLFLLNHWLGLRIAPPEAPHNGYAYGKGLYMARNAMTSVGYCCTYQTNGQGLLLMVKSAIGKPNPNYHYSSATNPTTPT